MFRWLMKFDCFYKVKITRGKKTKIERWGYYPYNIVIKDVKKLYKEGADAVELEMIKQEEFDLQMELEQQIITQEEFDKQNRKYERI